MTRSFHARATLVLSALLVVLGVLVFVRTTLAGGGVGLLLGALLALAGALRLYLSIR